MVHNFSAINNTKDRFVSCSKNFEGGFVMLYAILLTSIMLTIGMAILDISIRQLTMTGVDKESARAFYVADAGLECALHGDLIDDSFGTSTPGTITCNGTSIALVKDTSVPNHNSYTFNYWDQKTSARNKTCAEIVLDRTIDPGNGSITSTVVRSLGYNTECPGVGAATRFPLVERGLQATY